MSRAFIIDGVRTPTGRYAAGRSAVRPDDLGAHLLGELVARNSTAESVLLERVS
jgi:acetyl-CoA acetyltransferase